MAGLALIVAGIGFKLSLVPFHMWAPDVYEGAPAPVTAFIAVVSKGAVFALFLRYYLAANAHGFPSALIMIGAVAIASILAGNLLALLQNNVKRVLAYSSIAHLGYLLVALLAGGALAVEAVTYYLMAYFVMTLGAFGVVTVLSSSGPQDDLDDLNDYRGLLWRRPWLAGVFTAMLLSLAGIPLTAGFMAKFYAITAGVGAGLWPAVFALVAGSVIGLFYYLRIIVVMSLRPPAEMTAGAVPWSSGATLAVLTFAVIVLGVYPTPLVQTIRTAVSPVAGGSSSWQTKRAASPLRSPLQRSSSVTIAPASRRCAGCPLSEGVKPWYLRRVTLERNHCGGRGGASTKSAVPNDHDLAGCASRSDAMLDVQPG